MATNLTAQLAQIRAHSTKPLDLKAQKKAHSQSLLFDSRNAAIQDFDTIYQICYEGFEELCRLDPRFAQFAGGIFSEQSKQTDRTQMTAAENQELDTIIEQFLGLISSRILLKPALKAVEWLVRRFRIHEKNTVSLVLTLLPYHTTATFVAVLSVLPQILPHSLKFLHPYIQSLTNPPRHTIVYAASHSRPFFSALSTHMLKVSRMGYQCSTLTSFWASTATEAVAAMLDNARSARLESQKQNQEDVMLCILPVLSEGLTLDTMPDLRVGCYMVLTTLASKADLNDDVVTAMMEAVISGWDQTSHAGLICLSVLAQQRESAQLPVAVLDALLALEQLDDDFAILSKHYRVDKLILGVVLGITSRIESTQESGRLGLITRLLEANYMDQASTIAAIQYMLSTAQTPPSEITSAVDAQGSLTDLLLRLADSTSVGNLVHATINSTGLDMGPLQMRLQNVTESTESSPQRKLEDLNIEGEAMKEDFETLTSRIPTKTAYEMSFLSHSDSYVFSSLAHAFSLLSASDADIERFTDLPVLRKSLASTEPLFLSFFMRLWCGDSPTNARAAALRAVSREVGKGHLKVDVQILLPYVIYALADPFPKVRHAAADLLMALERVYSNMGKAGQLTDLPVLGHEQIYGQGKETKALSWLSISESRKFMAELLVPGLEECLVDSGHMAQLLSGRLSGSKHTKDPKNAPKDLRSSLRLAVFNFLGSHIVNTPLYTVKYRFLQSLNQVTNVSSTSRTKLLFPVFSDCVRFSQDEFDRLCRREQLNPLLFLEQVMGIVIPTDREGVQALKAIIESGTHSSFPTLTSAALHRIRTIWPSIKPDHQPTLANTLLKQALDEALNEASKDHDDATIETLRALPLSTSVLQSFVEGLPSLSPPLEVGQPTSKRRRTSHGHSTEIEEDPQHFNLAIKHITLVLELLDDAKTERHPELLKGLFKILPGLQHPQSHAKAATDYLLVLTIDSIFAIVKQAQISSGPPLDHTAINTDILIDCVRFTTSSQVRNKALLLISTLATTVPQLVLHSVMPIFTFMSSNLLHQDDDFSAHVVRQTMESIIPRLVQSFNKRKDGSLPGIAELFLSFAAAYNHIPTQRRLDLFTSLIDKVGPGEYFFVLLAILVDKYPNDRRVLEFAADLTCRYDAKVRLLTLEKYLSLVIDVRKPKPTFSASILMAAKEISVENLTEHLLQIPTIILSNHTMASGVTKQLNKGGDDAVAIRSLYSKMLEEIFILAQQSKGSKKMDVSCKRILDASLGLPPIRELIDTLRNLLGGTNNSIRRQILRSFENRLSNANINDKATQTACIGFLPQLLSIIKESGDVQLRHIAINCVDKITEKYGKKDVPSVIDSAQIVSSDMCLGSVEGKIRISSLICLATMVEVTGDAFIPIVPYAFGKALDHLASSIQADVDDAKTHNAVFTFLSAHLLYLPWVVTGADLDRLLKISYQSANAEMGEDCDQIRIDALHLIPRKVEAKECFGALRRTWADAMPEGPLAVKEYLDVLGSTIDQNPKSIIVKLSETLGDLLLKLFDFRRVQLSPPTEDSYSLDEVAEVEDGVNEAAISMVYKLNDATFRPLFSRILEWTGVPDLKHDGKSKTNAMLYRQATWYKFLLKFFDTLKSIVTSYAGLIVENSVEILKKPFPEDEDYLFLWKQVILTLHKTFEHDQDDFYQSPNHFAPISEVLISQLKYAARVPLSSELIPAVAELAVATDSETHQQEMNRAILQYMRSDSSAVRLAAVQCQRALTGKLGEEWLTHLSEMLPFINEGMEDDDEMVEREVQRWKADVEGIVGENLDPMLQ